jgi:hypothetical protein
VIGGGQAVRPGLFYRFLSGRRGKKRKDDVTMEEFKFPFPFPVDWLEKLGVIREIR